MKKPKKVGGYTGQQYSQQQEMMGEGAYDNMITPRQEAAMIAAQQ
jgi:hypothetical protein